MHLVEEVEGGQHAPEERENQVPVRAPLKQQRNEREKIRSNVRRVSEYCFAGSLKCYYFTEKS